MGALLSNKPGAVFAWLAPSGAALAALAVTVAACSLAVDLDGLAGGPADAGTADGDASESCSHAAPPTRPVGGSSADAAPIVAAIRSVDFGESSTEESPVGLDLDWTCTCRGEGQSCEEPKFADKEHCDDANGVDNAGAKMFKALLAVGTENIGSSFYTMMAEQGEWNLLLSITGYNGEADDELVTVSLYPSPGMNEGAGGAGGAGMGGAGGAGGNGAGGGGGFGMGALFGEPPGWKGQDAWPVATAGLKDGASIDQPVYSDPNAYVAGNVLVATFPELRFRFKGPSSNLSMNVRSITVIGRLETVGDGLGVRVTKGVVAGYWRMEDVFGALDTLQAGGKMLCDDGGLLYTQTKGVLCDFIDIGLGAPGEKVTCNALSFGMGFETFPAKLGPVVVAQPESAKCAPEQSPVGDVCD